MDAGAQAGPSGQAAPDDWELDPADIAFQEKIASGAFGDLYKGSYCGQDVAIKILRNVHTDTQQYGEFLQVRTHWGVPGCAVGDGLFCTGSLCGSLSA